MAIRQGDRVSVHYTGRLEDGQVFDTSVGKEPLSFTVGSGELIPGFDKGVLGKEIGDKVTVECPPEEAYGPTDPERVLEIQKNQLEGVDPEVGQILGLQDEGGQSHQATVVGVNPETVNLDFNHVLAGKKLIFDIEVLSVGS